MFEGGVLKVLLSALVVMKGKKKGNLYFFQGCTLHVTLWFFTEEQKDSTRLWHMQLGHFWEKTMAVLGKQGLLKGAKSCKLESYEHCVLSKQILVKFGTTIHFMNGLLYYVHMDVWGPSNIKSLGESIFCYTL